jgi:hypothetical protein
MPTRSRSAPGRNGFWRLHMNCRRRQRLGLSERSLLEGSSGWHGQGAEAFRRVMEHLREDLRTTSEAMTQATGALNMLAMQLDQVNQMYHQAEQLEYQIRSLDNSYWSADEVQRESIRHEISRLRERHASLLHQAQIQERQANDAAAVAFDQAGANVNRLHFFHVPQGGLKEAASTALDEVGHFFGQLWGKAKQAAHDAEEAVEGTFDELVGVVKEEVQEVGVFAEGFTAQYLHNASMGLADPLHEEFPEDRSKQYRAGRVGADIYSTVEGIVKMVGGGALVAGGGAEAVVTSETVALPAIGVVAISAGGALAGAGYKQFTEASSQLGKDWSLFRREEGGGRAAESGDGDEIRKVLEEYDNLKDTDQFQPSAIEHIMEGTLNARGVATGYHFEGIPDTPGRIIPGTESLLDRFGTYKATVEVNGVPKPANGGRSTFFAKDMSPQQIVDSINEAYSSKVFEGGNSYFGYVQSGQKTGMIIKMFVDREGKIISAFPIMRE